MFKKLLTHVPAATTIVFFPFNQSCSNELSILPHDTTKETSYTNASNQDLKMFLELPFSTEDKSMITEFLKFYSTCTMTELIEEQERFNHLRTKAQTIHMLRILGFIITDPEVKQITKSIVEENDLKLAYALLVFETTLIDILEMGLSEQQISGFAKFSGLDKDMIQNYIGQENYQGLAKYLLRI